MNYQNNLRTWFAWTVSSGNLYVLLNDFESTNAAVELSDCLFDVFVGNVSLVPIFCSLELKSLCLVAIRINTDFRSE